MVKWSIKMVHFDGEKWTLQGHAQFCHCSFLHWHQLCWILSCSRGLLAVPAQVLNFQPSPTISKHLFKRQEVPSAPLQGAYLLWSFLVLILSLLDSLILWNKYFLVSTYLAFLICVCVCGIIMVSWCLFLGTKVLKMYFQIYWRQSSNIFTSKHY